MKRRTETLGEKGEEKLNVNIIKETLRDIGDNEMKKKKRKITLGERGEGEG